MQVTESVIDARKVVGEGSKHPHIGGKLDHAHLVLRAKQGVGKTLGRGSFLAHILFHAAAGIDGQGNGQRHGRLALEQSDFLRTSILGDGEIVLGEVAYDGAIGVRHIHEHVHQLDVHVQRGAGVLLRVKQPCRKNGKQQEEGRWPPTFSPESGERMGHPSDWAAAAQAVCGTYAPWPDSAGSMASSAGNGSP